VVPPTPVGAGPGARVPTAPSASRAVRKDGRGPLIGGPWWAGEVVRAGRVLGGVYRTPPRRRARRASPRTAPIARPRPTEPPRPPLLVRPRPRRAERTVLPEDADHALVVRSAPGPGSSPGSGTGPVRSPPPSLLGPGCSAARGAAARGAGARPRAGGPCSGR